MTPNFFSRRTSLSEGEQAPASLRPQPPLAKRLNRNALTVAAVIMGMTVLTAIVVLSPGRGAEKASTPQPSVDEPPPVPPRPAFLDEPVRPPIMDSGSGRRPDRANVGESSPSPSNVAAPSAVLPHQTVDALPVQAAMPPAARDPAAASREPEDSPRERAYQAALASAPVVSGAAATSSAAPNGGAASLATEEEQMVTLGDSILRAAIRPAAAAGGGMPASGGMPAAGATPTLGTSQHAAPADTVPLDAARSFASRAAASTGGTTIAALEPASSPYTLTAGTVIPGLLLTGINSDLPGEIVGQVSRPVYDSRTQRIILIPRGSRLIGTYDNQIAAGQGRLLVAWTRLIFPDGRSLRLPGLALTDPAGQSGAPGTVDTHWRRVFGNALLLSAISAGAQVSQPAQASVLSTPSARQVAAGAVGQELSQVAIEILRRGMDVAPTITIRAGQPFNVFLSGDLVFDGPADTSR